MMRQLIFPAMTAIAITMLAGCDTLKSAAQTPSVQESLNANYIDSLTGKRAETEKRLATAASDAIAEGRTTEALKLYAERYKRSSRDKDIALNYAQLLRKSGAPEKAAKVLKRYAKSNHGALVNEYAATQIELASYDTAITALDRVLTDDAFAETRADAQHLMGVALDAQGKHQEAERLFRLSLEGLQGDKTSVMNNLALSLASQGNFDEALMTLRQALVMAPERNEIARNIEIVSGLRAAVVPQAPVRLRK